MIDTKMLEFWGNAFLSAARNQQKLEELNRLLGQNTGADNSILNVLYEQWPDAKKMNPEEIVEFAGKAADLNKELIKSYLTIFNVVSKEEYLSVIKENEGLKEKIAEQERLIDNFRNMLGKPESEAEEIVSNFTQMIEKQTKQFQELLMQLNPYYEKSTPLKKNKG
jgi:hypothetical protein